MSFKGILEVAPNNAVITRDTELFGSMDPYVIIKCGASTFRTK